MSKTGNIRILKTGLTIGPAMYTEGDIVPPKEHTHDLIALANGKKHVGFLWAEWEMAEHRPVTEHVTPVVQPAPEPVKVLVKDAEASVPAPKPTPDPAPVDLAKAIKELVMAGLGKTKIVHQLAEPEDVSQKQVAAEFDKLLATGQVVATDVSGVYKVQG